MRIADSLLNRSEKVAFRELSAIARDNGLNVFAKPRLSDVIIKEKTFLTQRVFDFYISSHCDFVVTDENDKPIMVIEYDGPSHKNQKQVERDKIKNELCRNAELGLLRIHDRHVTKTYGGMTILRWIVEVVELQKSFYDAQSRGQITYDEPFDPASLVFVDGHPRNPYRLSGTATQSFHDFLNTIPRDVPKGWVSILGIDKEKTIHRLSCFHFGDQIVHAKTSIRNQDLDFPHDDLLSEIDQCELEIRFQMNRKGEIPSVSRSEFRKIFEDFCHRYNAHPSFSMGYLPFDASWRPDFGWTLGN